MKKVFFFFTTFTFCRGMNFSLAQKREFQQTKKDGEQICSPFSSGRRNRTSGLWVMSPTSYHCSTPRCILNSCAKILLFFNSAKFSAEKYHPKPQKVQKRIKYRFSRQFSRHFLHKTAQMCNFAETFITTQEKQHHTIICQT